MSHPVQTPLAIVVVADQFAGFFDHRVIEDSAIAAIRRELKSGPPCVTVTVTSDDELRELNRDFRGIDRPTDVLSFAANEASAGTVGADEFVASPDEQPTLGDVVISFQQALRQADVAGRPVEHELALLTVHGVLHLLGYDHAEADDEAVMFGKTDEILAEVLGPDALPITPVMDALDDVSPVAGEA